MGRALNFGGGLAKAAAKDPDRPRRVVGEAIARTDPGAATDVTVQAKKWADRRFRRPAHREFSGAVG